MDRRLMYIELKTGYHDDGPAWIGYVMTSASGKTIYLNDRAFQKWNSGSGNYYDVESGEDYWLTGVKKRESNRHWAGHGKIMIDRRAVEEFLDLIGEPALPKTLYEVIDMEDRFPVERINKLFNSHSERQ